MNIGVLSRNYAAQRLFLGKLHDATYKDIRLYNGYLWKNILPIAAFRLGISNRSPEEFAALFLYQYHSLLPTDCDLYHFFNCICYDKHTPWVISVESAVPWTIDVTHVVESEKPDFSTLKDNICIKQHVEALASPSCMAILPISQCSYNIQKELNGIFPQHYDALMRKTMVLPPPQKLIIHNISEKGLTWSDDETFTFIYVGRNYFRKGGRESVDALIELRKRYKFKLILISSLAVDEKKYLLYDNEVERTRKLIADNSDWIEYYDELPNAEIISLMKRSHVCLLPTWMDTYAYSVLESQACGTPLITTSLRALNETNSDAVGWRVSVPVNRLDNPLLNTVEQRAQFREHLYKGLKEKIEYVLTHRNEVKEKSINCIDRIAQHHNPECYVEKLSKIYDSRLRL